MADHILSEEVFPIVGWAGPGGDMIRDDVMAGMAEAGFTVSLSSPHATPEGMVRPDGSTTETWEIARRINRQIHTWAPLLKHLRNIGVFHHGPLWEGTRPLPQSSEPLSVTAEGDPATIGFFLDESDRLHLLVVNANPCAWAKLTLKVAVEKEKLYYVDPRDGVVRELWPPNPRAQLVALAPVRTSSFRYDIKYL